MDNLFGLAFGLAFLALLVYIVIVAFSFHWALGLLALIVIFGR
jgi:hypothetical protein